jgi:hypothetical protein
MANNTLNPLNPSINLIPKLEDSNFFEWKRTITGHLTAMGKLKYIKSEVTRPEDDAAAEIFIQERAQVLQAIRLTINKENRSAIIHFDDPHCAFKALEEKHGSNDAFMIASTIAEIVHLKFEDTSSLDDYISQIRALHNRLNDMTKDNEAFQLPDNVLAIFMIINLPTDEFRHIIQSLFSNKTVSVKQVIDRLNSESAMMKGSTGKETAMYGFKKPKQSARSNTGTSDRCNIHKFSSHTNAECNAQKKPTNKTNQNSARLPSANAATEANESATEDCPDLASLMIENAYVIVHNPELDYYSFTGNFIADSGASIHLVNDYKMLINPEKCEPRLINTAKSETQVRVDTKGSVRILARNNLDQKVSIDIPNVFYCPDLAANLLSIKQIIKSGAHVSFLNNTMTIEFKNENVYVKSVTLGNDLWTVSILKHQSPEIIGLCANIWHARFGHPSTGAYRQYHLDGSKLPVKPSVCEHCIKGKIQRKPFISSLPISSRPLYRIYSDIMGPMPVATNNGFRYILTFIDCCTRYSKIYLLKRKSETLSRFKEYVNTVENFMSGSNFKVSIIHSDRGGEYNSNNFTAYIKSKGISVEQGPANTPQQNGVAERYNKTLIQKMLAIMSAGKIPKWLWGEIAITASLLINIAPSSTLKSDNPHRLWMHHSDPKGSHHKFDYSFLRTIGCRAYIKIDKRDKLAMKASELIMIGYDHMSKAYRLLDPSSKKVIISRNAVFNETLFPYSVTPSGTNSETFDFDSIDALFNPPFTKTHVTESLSSHMDSHGTQREEQSHTPDTLGEPSHQNNPPQPTISPDTSTTLSRPSRSCGRPNFYGNPVAHMSQQNPDEPTYRQAMASEDRDKWVEAMQAEYNSLVQHNVGELVDIPPGGHHIGGMWRLKVKRDHKIQSSMGSLR